MIAAGGRRLLVVLSPEANAALEAISAPGESAKSAIERALIKAAARSIRRS